MSKGIVLLVDDESEILETYQAILLGDSELADQIDQIESIVDGDNGGSGQKEDEFTLITALSGKEAVERHQKILQSGDHVSAALLDMRMPPGISGLETAVELRRLDPNIYIVIITAYSDYGVNELQAALQHDFILLSKPVNSEEFLQVTRNAVISYERFQQASHPLYFPSVAEDIEQLKQSHVLVVDNDLLIQSLCSELLSRCCHYETSCADSGGEAIELLEQGQCTPDLILMDVMMPGIDGYEACKRIKADPRFSEIPVVFLTARGDETDIVQGFRVGGADYITKPFSQEELLARVVTHVNQYRQSLRETSRYKNSMLKVIGSVNEGMIITNHLGEITLVNDVVERITDVDRDQLLGRTLSSLFVETLNREKTSFSETSLHTLERRLKLLQEEHPIYCQQLLNDAPMGVLEVSLEDGAIQRVNHRAQQLLQHEERQLLGKPVEQWIPNLLSVIVGSAYGETLLQIVDGEETDEVMLGFFPATDESKRNALILMRRKQFDLDWLLVRLTAFGQLFESDSEREDSHEWTLRCTSGEDIPVLLQGGVYQDVYHQIEGGVITLFDLRERKRAEAHQQFEAFQAGVSEMSATILHNIGNAIQGISTGATQLESKLGQYLELIDMIEQFNRQELSPEVRQQRQQQLVEQLPQIMRELVDSDNEFTNLSPIEMIQHSAQHVSEIIQMHRRGFSMDQKEERTALAQLMSDALLLVGNSISRSGIELEEHLELNGLRDGFMLPKNQLLQALINMIKNAVESIVGYRQSGGRLKFSISTIERKEKDTHYLSIEVSDNGVGISEEAIGKVLEFGYSTKNRGSGFGLHATANFVRSLDGDIEIESKGIGRGAIVRLLLPAIQDGVFE